MRLRRALAPQVRREDYNLARMSGMLDLSKDEKAKAGWLRPRRRAVDRAAARPFKQILHQAFSHSAESSEKRFPLTAIFAPYPASGRIFRVCSIGTTRAMGRPYRMIVKETTPDSTSESIPEKFAFASFTLIVVVMMESSVKPVNSLAQDGLLCQLRLVGQLYAGRGRDSQ